MWSSSLSLVPTWCLHRSQRQHCICSHSSPSIDSCNCIDEGRENAGFLFLESCYQPGGTDRFTQPNPDLFVHPSVSPSVRPSVHQSVSPPVRPSVMDPQPFICRNHSNMRKMTLFAFVELTRWVRVWIPSVLGFSF